MHTASEKNKKGFSHLKLRSTAGFRRCTTFTQQDQYSMSAHTSMEKRSEAASVGAILNGAPSVSRHLQLRTGSENARQGDSTTPREGGRTAQKDQILIMTL